MAVLATGVALAGTPAFAGSARDWKIVAHRGGLSNGVQHSLTLLTAMLKTKADAVEIDVQMTRDHVPVLLHDDTSLSALTKNCSGRVSRRSLDYIRGCILKNPSGDPAYDNQHVMRLASAMNLFDDKARGGFDVFLHVKTVDKDDARRIANVVDRFAISRDTVVISGSKTMLGYLKKQGLSKQGLVFNSTAGWSTGYKYLIPYNITVNSTRIRTAHRKGQRVLPVESRPHSLAALDKVDVDGVLANNLLEALIRSGRLAGTSQARASVQSTHDVPASGRSRTTGPMDF